MSQLHVGLIKGRTGAGITFDANSRVTGVTTFNGSQQGINVISGVTTSSISGNITGTGATFTSITGALSGNATGLSGTPTITVQDITATTISVGGTLTYEDVTNVDSVGLITARKGMVVSGVSTFLGEIRGVNAPVDLSTFHNVTGNLVATAATVGSAVTMNTDGIIANLVGSAATVGTAVTMNTTGLIASGIIGFGGMLIEKANVTAGKLSGNQDINVSKGMVHLFTTVEDTTSTPNIISNAGINTDLAVGDQISVTIVVNAAAAGYANSIKIDGTSEGCHWVGGSVPSEGGTNTDIYSFNIIKTGNGAYTTIGNQSKTTS